LKVVEKDLRSKISLEKRMIFCVEIVGYDMKSGWADRNNKDSNLYGYVEK
jgi:hypothetical protein